jgi:hypothetical protein
VEITKINMTDDKAGPILVQDKEGLENLIGSVTHRTLFLALTF